MRTSPDAATTFFQATKYFPTARLPRFAAAGTAALRNTEIQHRSLGKPDFHRTHATQTSQLTADLAAAKENLAKLYTRWEDLEAIKAAAERLC